MFNNRKNQLLAFILDFVLYSFIFSTDYYDSIFLSILKFGFWISISYVFNKYNFTETKLIDIFKRQIICCLLCLAFILGIKNVINLFIENYFLFQLKDLIKLIFFSFLINSLLNLYLNPSKDLNRKWFFVGSKERFYVLQNKLKICNENLNVFLFNKSNLNKINKNSFLIIDDYSDNSENLENLKNLPQINKIKLDHWFEKILKRYPSDLISDNLLRELQISKIMNTFEYKLKSLIERFVALILLLVSSPIILLTLIVVFLEDRHSPLFFQKRTGVNNKTIIITKIRTMKFNVSKRDLDWAKNNDSRITKIGSFIRMIRIDELPQLVSVISGDISLIGPRPERPEIDTTLAKEIKEYRLRYCIKPGLSGWAQVNYPYGASIQDSDNKWSYDIFYMKNYSLLLDLIIFLKTIRLVFNGKGSKPIS